MPSTRRTLLGSVASALAVGLAGCVTSPGDGPETDSSPTTAPTGTDTGSPTDTEPSGAPPTPLPDRLVEWPDGPKERPSIPDDLTDASVRDFVDTHEYRYVYNTLWYSEYSEVHCQAEVHTVVDEGPYYRVVASATGYSNTGGPTEGTASATQVHADYFTQWHTTLVDENSVLRREATEAERARAKE